MSVSIEQLSQILEAALMASREPLNIKRMQRLFEEDRPDAATVQAALENLQADCSDRAYELKEVGSGWRFQVRETYSSWVSRLWEEKPQRYTRALLETLALIAYRQPITRGEIEDVRGVAVSSNIMRTLQEREWVRVVGHRDVPGRPSIFATTKTFLDYFNLSSLDQLPSLAELKNIDEIGKTAEEAVTRALAKAGVTLEEAKQLHDASEKTNQDDDSVDAQAGNLAVQNTDQEITSSQHQELGTDELLTQDEQALTIHAQEEN